MDSASPPPNLITTTGFVLWTITTQVATCELFPEALHFGPPSASLSLLSI